MRAQLREPALNILKRLLLCDVVDQERSRSTAIVRRCNSSVSVLASCVPNLRLNHIACLRGYRSSRKLDADRSTRLQVELVLGEACQQIGLTYT